MELRGMYGSSQKIASAFLGVAALCCMLLATPSAFGQTMLSGQNVGSVSGDQWLWTPSATQPAQFPGSYPNSRMTYGAPAIESRPLPTISMRRLPAVENEKPQEGETDKPSQKKESEDDKKNDEQSEDSDKPIGEAPEDISEIFLRQSTVLLKPGEGQVDWGFLYTWQETRQTVVLNNGQLTTEHARDRQLVIPLNIRYGIQERAQVFAQLPMGYAIFERADIQQDEVTSRLGTGDLVVGFQRLLSQEKIDSPDIIGSLSIGAPIGNHAFHPSDSAAIGSGFWSLNAGVNFVKSFDPIVLFTGLGYTHFYQAEHVGQSIQPGELFNYSFGLGFAVNDSIVLSGELSGALQTYFYSEGQRIPNSLTEPYSLRFALTQVLCKDRFLEPYVILGLTSDAPDLQVGIFHTFGF
jgi:hypothetical protein